MIRAKFLNVKATSFERTIGYYGKIKKRKIRDSIHKERGRIRMEWKIKANNFYKLVVTSCSLPNEFEFNNRVEVSL